MEDISEEVNNEEEQENIWCQKIKDKGLQNIAAYKVQGGTLQT